MPAGVEALDDRIDDACGAVDDVERRVEAMFLRLPRGDLRAKRDIRPGGDGWVGGPGLITLI